MSGEITAETPVAGFVAPIFEIVRSGRRRTPAARRSSGFHLLPPASWSPAVNVFDTGEAFVVIAELAGVGPDSLRIELDCDTDTVTLRGTRVGLGPFAEAEAVDEEIAAGRFERAIPLGQAVDVNGARAVCRYGMLEIMLPKLPGRTPRRAPIRSVSNRRSAVAC